MPGKASKETIKLETKEPVYYLDEDVTYARSDAWFGHVTRDLRMNIIYPQAQEGQYPCIVWICGGGWMQMDKGAHIPYLADLARRGFAVASVQYRLSHEAPFPGALVDIKAAIRYLRAHAERYCINADKIGVMGESAGGYLAAMAALARGKEFEEGEYLDFSSEVRAACPWYMPCDLAKLAKETGIKLPFFNGDYDDARYRSFVNPLSYITKQAPPFLLLHGDEDATVPLEHSEMMLDALLAEKTDARLIVLKGEGHAGLQFFQRPLWDMIAGFFKEKLG